MCIVQELKGERPSMCLETTKMNFIVLILVFVSLSVTVRTDDDDEGPVIPPSSCEGIHDYYFIIDLCFRNSFHTE